MNNTRFDYMKVAINGIADLIWRLGAFGTAIWMFGGLAGAFHGCIEQPDACGWVPFVVLIPTGMWLIGGLIWIVTSPTVEITP